MTIWKMSRLSDVKEVQQYQMQKLTCKNYEAVDGIQKMSITAGNKNSFKIHCKPITDCNEVSIYEISFCLL